MISHLFFSQINLASFFPDSSLESGRDGTWQSLEKNRKNDFIVFFYFI